MRNPHVSDPAVHASDLRLFQVLQSLRQQTEGMGLLQGALHNVHDGLPLNWGRSNLQGAAVQQMASWCRVCP